MLIILGLFSINSFGQTGVKVSDFAKIESLFEIKQINYDANGFGNKCFYVLRAKPEGKARPKWMKKKIYYGAYVEPPSPERVPSITMANLYMQKASFSFKEPVVYFKIASNKKVFIVYEKKIGKLPKD
jgi:hypothetical protein